MQDHDRALIVGQTSFGKGLVQSIINLPEGAGLTLTSAKYYTPSGRLIQRDYSEGGWYNYISHGGTLREADPGKPAGPAGIPTLVGRYTAAAASCLTRPSNRGPSRTRSSACVIRFSSSPEKWPTDEVAGLERYKVDRPIEYDHDVVSRPISR
jgi:carboxyl-terminal processing protease